LRMNYMKSCVELPITFRRGAANLMLACLLATPAVGFGTMKANISTSIVGEKLVNFTGKVVDQDGNPVVGATVLVKGTKSGVTTDETGTFRINLPERNTTI